MIIIISNNSMNNKLISYIQHISFITHIIIQYYAFSKSDNCNSTTANFNRYENERITGNSTY